MFSIKIGNNLEIEHGNILTYGILYFEHAAPDYIMSKTK